MGDTDELSGGDLPRDVLEALTVPELPNEFTDRVMTALGAAPIGIARVDHMTKRRRPIVVERERERPWIFASAAAALALAAVVVLVLLAPGRNTETTPPPEPSIPAPTHDVAAPVLSFTPPVPPPTERAPGHLVLVVEPMDAEVAIDGRAIPGPPPFVATNLEPGMHTITVNRDGYVALEKRIDVPSGELHLPITLLATPGVETPKRSRPSGSSPDLKNPFRGPADGGGGDLLDPWNKPKSTVKKKASKGGSSEFKDPFEKSPSPSK